MDIKNNWLHLLITVLLSVVGALYIHGVDQTQRYNDTRIEENEVRSKLNESRHYELIGKVTTKDDLNNAVTSIRLLIESKQR